MRDICHKIFSLSRKKFNLDFSHNRFPTWTYPSPDQWSKKKLSKTKGIQNELNASSIEAAERKNNIGVYVETTSENIWAKTFERKMRWKSQFFCHLNLKKTLLGPPRNIYFFSNRRRIRIRVEKKWALTKMSTIKLTSNWKSMISECSCVNFASLMALPQWSYNIEITRWKTFPDVTCTQSWLKFRLDSNERLWNRKKILNIMRCINSCRCLIPHWMIACSNFSV